MPQSSTPSFSGIFISYRREDSSGHAGRLFDRLVDHFGKDRIFMDIDTIEPGEDFVTVIEDAVSSCQILIAIIGRHWLSSADDSTRRLDNPNDFVRLEIAAALNRDIRVIPVLVQGATMPRPQDLPNDVSKLSRRNALELSDLRWQRDVGHLIGAMERLLVESQEAIRLAETARQEKEYQRHDEEERRRIEEEEQLRSAEEKAKRRAAEERRRDDGETGRREAQEKARHEVQEASRRRAVEERDGAETEARSQEARRRLEVEAALDAERLRREEAGREWLKAPDLLTPTSAAVRKRVLMLVLGSLAAAVIVGSIVLLLVGLKTYNALWPKKSPDSASVIGAEGIATADLNVRSTPSSENEPVGLAENGSRVRVLSVNGNWYEIQILQHGRVSPEWVGKRSEKGWVNNKYVKLDVSGSVNDQQPRKEYPPSFKNQYGIEMVFLPPGSFMMGSTNGKADEMPVHQVTISQPFYMGKYEVTQGQWHSVMGMTLRQECDKGHPCTIVGEGDAYPMYSLSWEEAMSFVERLTALNDRYIYRLPTEAEWEYACRAGTTGDYAGDLDSLAWYGNNSGNGYIDATSLKQNDEANFGQRMLDHGGKTHTVGTKLPNRFGLYDMLGNVWEWCEDWYHPSYDRAPAEGSAWLSDGEQKARVARGGAWGSAAAGLRSAGRSKANPGYRGYGTGFRVVAVARLQ